MLWLVLLGLPLAWVSVYPEYEASKVNWALKKGTSGPGLISSLLKPRQPGSALIRDSLGSRGQNWGTGI